LPGPGINPFQEPARKSTISLRPKAIGFSEPSFVDRRRPSAAAASGRPSPAATAVERERTSRNWNPSTPPS